MTHLRIGDIVLLVTEQNDLAESTTKNYQRYVVSGGRYHLDDSCFVQPLPR